MNIQKARRLNNVQEYYFSTKIKEIAQIEKGGEKVINLGIGNPDNPPHPDVLESLVFESSKCYNHGYQDYRGIEELRESFALWYKKYYNITINHNTEVLPLMGSKEGVMHISMAYLNEGDEVLIPNPGYPTYASVSELCGANIIRYNLNEENAWLPNIGELEKLNLEKVKIMWINYPHMPTGANISIEKMKEIVDFTQRNNILLVNDNPYSFILNDKYLSIFNIEGAKENCLELNSLSKVHNMAGWRVGMLLGNETHINNVLRIKSNMDSGMFKPIQLAVCKALRLEESWYKNLNLMYAKRKLIANKIMDAIGAKYSKESAGMFVWAKIPEKYINAEIFSNMLLIKTRVFITPGSIFGDNGNNYIRISLCSSEAILQEALTRILKELN